VIYAGTWDAAYAAWGLDNFGDVSGLYGCHDMPPSGQNVPRWCNKRADAAMEAFKQEYDPVKRNRYDYIVSDEIASDVPIIVIDVRDAVSAFNSDLKGWHPNPVNPFDSMMEVDI
jgi:ABC-type transport system substrate-binding protein